MQVTYSTSLSLDVAIKLNDYCQKTNNNKSALIREAVIQYLRQEGVDV